MSDTIGERVVGVVARNQKVAPESISLKTTFDELGMSSLDALGLICELEEEFDIAIPNEDALRIRTVEEAVRTLRQLFVESSEGEAASAG